MVYTQGRLISIPIFFILNMVSEFKVSFLFVAVASASVAAGPPPDCRRTFAGLLPDLRRTSAGSSPDLAGPSSDLRRPTSVAGVPILTGNLEAVPPPWRLPLPLPILKTLLVCLTRPSTLTMLMYTYPLTS